MSGKGNIYILRDNIYNLRNFKSLYSTSEKTVRFGTETITFRDPQIWNLITGDIKKEGNQKTEGEKCSCRICYTYLQNVSYI